MFFSSPVIFPFYSITTVAIAQCKNSKSVPYQLNMKCLLLVAKSGTPIYYDHPDGPTLCELLVSSWKNTPETSEIIPFDYENLRLAPKMV
jgi:hypothetical protein